MGREINRVVHEGCLQRCFPFERESWRRSARRACKDANAEESGAAVGRLDSASEGRTVRKHLPSDEDSVQVALCAAVGDIPERRGR